MYMQKLLNYFLKIFIAEFDFLVVYIIYVRLFTGTEILNKMNPNLHECIHNFMNDEQNLVDISYI